MNSRRMSVRGDWRGPVRDITMGPTPPLSRTLLAGVLGKIRASFSLR